MQAKKQKKNNEIYERWNHFSMNERHGKWKTKIIKYNKKKTRNKCLLNECNNAMLNIYLLCRRCTIFFLAPCQSNLVWLMCDACFIHCQGVCIVKDTHVLSISLFVFFMHFPFVFFFVVIVGADAGASFVVERCPYHFSRIIIFEIQNSIVSDHVSFQFLNTQNLLSAIN